MNKNGNDLLADVPRIRKEFLIYFLLVLMTWVAYRDLVHHDFLAIDDNAYVTDNSFVQMGVTFHSVKWALTTLDAEFWHPLTWLSLMMDTTFYGVVPRGYLTTNLLLHIFNTLILFFVLFKMTHKIWRAFFVAALFAVHPLHVESVAWISERKDLLSTFFSLLTILTYYFYVKNQNPFRYAIVILFFILGLMAKSTLVTLPFLFIILDYWPLHRIHWPFIKGYNEGQYCLKPCSIMESLIEKIPLIGISILFSILTLFAQGKGGGLVPLSDLSLPDRMQISVAAYITYIYKMIWPFQLGVFYPIREITSLFHVLLFMILFCILCLLPIFYFKTKPYIAAGILWYLGTLFPMIGLVKIGDFSMADRFTYFPLIGLFMLLIWGGADLALTFLRIDSIIKTCSILALLLLTGMTYQQTTHWKDTFSLYTHTVSVTKDNAFCHSGLAKIYANRGDTQHAILHFRESVRIKPKNAGYQSDLGRMTASSGNFKAALTPLMTAYELNQRNEETLYYIGLTYYALKKDDLTILFFKELLLLLQKRFKSMNRALVTSHLNKLSACCENSCFQDILKDLHVKSGHENLKKAIEKGYNNWPYLKDRVKDQKIP